MEAQAEYDAAEADAAVAALNLQRSTVRATVNGMVTNFSMRPGRFREYRHAGDGDRGLRFALRGRVFRGDQTAADRDRRSGHSHPAGWRAADHADMSQGIAAGIADADRTASPTLLADVNPTFTWVRLAQRVPVRIKLDHVPAGTELVAGMTCTVTIGR